MRLNSIVDGNSSCNLNRGPGKLMGLLPLSVSFFPVGFQPRITTIQMRVSMCAVDDFIPNLCVCEWKWSFCDTIYNNKLFEKFYCTLPTFFLPCHSSDIVLDCLFAEAMYCIYIQGSTHFLLTFRVEFMLKHCSFSGQLCRAGYCFV